ncbi:unnamed protein product [Gordionus sp. m RMFG-2023]
MLIHLYVLPSCESLMVYRQNESLCKFKHKDYFVDSGSGDYEDIKQESYSLSIMGDMTFDIEPGKCRIEILIRIFPNTILDIWIDGDNFRAKLTSTSFFPETRFWPSWISISKSATSTKPFATYVVLIKDPKNIIIFKCIKLLTLEVKYL